MLFKMLEAFRPVISAPKSQGIVLRKVFDNVVSIDS